MPNNKKVLKTKIKACSHKFEEKNLTGIAKLVYHLNLCFIKEEKVLAFHQFKFLRKQVHKSKEALTEVRGQCIRTSPGHAFMTAQIRI